MATEFFRTSTTWVVDCRYKGRPRRWFRAFGPGIDVGELMSAELRQLYGDRAQRREVRPATDEEEAQFLCGDEPKSTFCPTALGSPDPGES